MITTITVQISGETLMGLQKLRDEANAKRPADQQLTIEEIAADFLADNVPPSGKFSPRLQGA